MKNVPSFNNIWYCYCLSAIKIIWKLLWAKHSYTSYKSVLHTSDLTVWCLSLEANFCLWHFAEIRGQSQLHGKMTSLTVGWAVGHICKVFSACLTVFHAALSYEYTSASFHFSKHIIYRSCRALCSNRGQTWTQREKPWVPSAGLTPHRSCHRSPLSSPPSPSEPRLSLSAVPKQGAPCKMGYSSASTVRDMTVHFELCGIWFGLECLSLFNYLWGVFCLSLSPWNRSSHFCTRFFHYKDE